MKYYGNEKDGISLNEPMHTLPTKDRVAVVETVQVPDTLTPEQMEGARRCAAFMHKYLPQHFKDPAEMVMVGGYVLIDITLRMLQPPELKAAQGFDRDYIIDRGLFVDPVTGAEEWRDIKKVDQVRLIGNSVCPDEAEALVAANAADIIEFISGSLGSGSRHEQVGSRKCLLFGIRQYRSRHFHVWRFGFFPLSFALLVFVGPSGQQRAAFYSQCKPVGFHTCSMFYF